MKQRLFLLVLLLLTGGSFWLLRGLERSLVTADKEIPTREIAVAYQVKGRYFSADNQLKYMINSDTVSEYSNGAGTRLQMPHVEVFNDPRQTHWQGRAQLAKLSADKNLLTLDGDVRLIDITKETEPTTISSEQMIYRADRREVSSDRAVRIENATMVQYADTFMLDISKQTVHFTGSVTASYQPLTEETP